jgi:hypothetical protein
MSLPNIVTPNFKLKLPSTEQEVTFRPFLVKEEKILLVAKEAGDEESMLDATLQVIDSCTFGELDVNKLSHFDIEFLFLNIRAKSVGEEVELRYKHANGINSKGEKCTAVTPIKINLEEVQVKSKEGHTKKIMLTETVGVKMKYPEPKTFTKIFNSDFSNSIEIIVDCIECLFDDQQIYDETTTRKEEMVQFIESLNSEQLLKINGFFDTMPELRHQVTYQCIGCGQEDRIVLQGLSDFF